LTVGLIFGVRFHEREHPVVILIDPRHLCGVGIVQALAEAREQRARRTPRARNTSSSTSFARALGMKRRRVSFWSSLFSPGGLDRSGSHSARGPDRVDCWDCPVVCLSGERYSIRPKGRTRVSATTRRTACRPQMFPAHRQSKAARRAGRPSWCTR
jgi:hypothetical protein